MLKIKLKILAVSSSNIVFLMLFPGFFFYQSAIGLGLIPPILGGYFGIVAILTSPLTFMAFLYLIGKHKYNYTIIDAIFFCIVTLTIFVTFVSYFLDKPSLYSTDMFIWSISGLLFNLECYFLARTISLSSNVFNYLSILSLVAMVLIILSHVGEHGIYNLKEGGDDSESLATYQGFARSLAVVGIFSMTTLNSSKLVFLISLVTMVGLFFNGARTEFALFFVSYLTLIIYVRRTSFNNIALTIFLFLVISIASIANFDNLLALLPKNRMLQLLDISSTSSWQARANLITSAIETIYSNPLVGNYGSYTNIGGVGSYPHNLLSAWVNLGAIGFGLYLITILIIVKDLIQGFLRKKVKTSEEKTVLVFSVFTIFALIAAKDYTYMLFGFMVGFYSRFNTASRLNRFKMA